jgi:hypothetical protein
MGILDSLRKRNNAYNDLEQSLIKLFNDGYSYEKIITKLSKIIKEYDLDIIDEAAVLDKLADKYNKLKRNK